MEKYLKCKIKNKKKLCLNNKCKTSLIKLEMVIFY